MLSRETTRDGPYYWRDQTAVGVLTAAQLRGERSGEKELKFNAAAADRERAVHSSFSPPSFPSSSLSFFFAIIHVGYIAIA